MPSNSLDMNKTPPVPRTDLRVWLLCRPWHLPLLLTVWAGFVIGGMAVLWTYEHAAGSVRPSPPQWPASTRIEASPTHPTLIFFAHPRCPCTRASIEELAKIMTVCRNDVRAYAVFVQPPGSSTGKWAKTDLWQRASQIPGVTAIVDIDGVEAQLFQAATSGFAMLYDRRGQLLFRGGITSSRGHSGDNLGRSAIVQFLTHGTSPLDNTQVFGCALDTNFSGLDQPCCQK